MSAASGFQHTAARRRLDGIAYCSITFWPFQHTAARRRLGHNIQDAGILPTVSTHSRPKAAGLVGGNRFSDFSFQHTAARRRLVFSLMPIVIHQNVSTHSRPKAAGPIKSKPVKFLRFQHTAARRRLDCPCQQHGQHDGFNTQPPEGGWYRASRKQLHQRSFNTQPPEGGWI